MAERERAQQTSPQEESNDVKVAVAGGGSEGGGARQRGTVPVGPCRGGGGGWLRPRKVLAGCCE